MIPVRVLQAAALAVCIPLSMAASAAENKSVLDTCIEKARFAREGVVTGWQELTDKPEDGYYVRIVGKDGGVGLTQCRPGGPEPLEFEKKTGLVRYEMYQRAKIAEADARAVAPVVFVPPTRVSRMELSISMRGVPYYTYTVLLPQNHKATVEVDAVTGKPMKATVEYAK
jgi:hypothetical protein